MKSTTSNKKAQEILAQMSTVHIGNKLNAVTAEVVFDFLSREAGLTCLVSEINTTTSSTSLFLLI
jgi:hypothetical protein